MPEKTLRTSEPAPFPGGVTFEPADFFALSEAMCANPEANARRLTTRRKLLTLGKEAARDLGLECRTSLHHPTAFNGNRVRRLWAYLTRSKGKKRELKSVLGGELGKDLDAAYRNAYLCLAIEAEALETSLRIHPDAWYDGQNLKNKIERTREGLSAWRGELNRLTGFLLRMDDWKGEWRCGELTTERLEEFLSYYVPGEHRLTVERRWPAATVDASMPATLKAELARLAPLLAFTAWSGENSHLFSR